MLTIHFKMHFIGAYFKLFCLQSAGGRTYFASAVVVSILKINKSFNISKYPNSCNLLVKHLAKFCLLFNFVLQTDI